MNRESRRKEVNEIEAKKMEEEAKLLASIAANIEELESLLERCNGNWGYEDPLYRFYVQSFKVYQVQERTQEIVSRLQALAPHLPLNSWFVEIVQQGTGREYTYQDDNNWTAVTRPMVEAFLHARYFLEMICKYGRILPSPPESIPSGWAAVLCLYKLR